jgi:hypothetical protein
MDIKTAVQNVSKRFRYSADADLKGIDQWFVMPERKDGLMYGDCDDFSVTAIWECCDRSLLKFILNVFILHRYRLYHATAQKGGSHLVGYAQGLWFDNWTMAAVDKKTFINETKHDIEYFYFVYPMVLYFIKGFFYRNKKIK